MNDKLKKPEENTIWESDEGMRFYIERVSEDDDFYMVDVIDEASKDDPFAAGDELTKSEWLEMVKRYDLKQVC